jgi:hypothetical protein
MSIDVEYGLKKDIRNNPVVREVDSQQKSELHRTLLLAGLTVAMVLFSAWQHFETVKAGYALEQLKLEQAKELVMNRQLRLNLETQRAPQDIERRAGHELGLVAPSARDTVVIERARSSSPDTSVVAHLR